MSKELIVPYTKRIIPPRGRLPERVIYAPYLQTFLSFGLQHLGFLFPSIVDSGADRCVFPSAFARRIGVDMKTVQQGISQGLGGGDIIYFHTVTVRIIVQEQTWQFNGEVGFADSLNNMGVGFLGRRGFFELFEEIIFNEHRREFRLKLNDNEEV